MLTARETETLRQSIKMRLSQYAWYLGSNIVPDGESYAVQVEVSRMDPDVWSRIPSKIKDTNIKIHVKEQKQSITLA